MLVWRVASSYAPICCEVVLVNIVIVTASAVILLVLALYKHLRILAPPGVLVRQVIFVAAPMQ
jgi:hypothetical protein